MRRGSDAQIIDYNVSLSAPLKIDRKKGSEWGMLKVSDELRDSIFNALDLPENFKLPDYSAHISVFDRDEVLELPKKLEEEGELFKFTLENIATCNPESWEEVSELYMVQVFSPELQQLRRKYGFDEKMHDNKHEFHITLCINDGKVATRIAKLSERFVVGMIKKMEK